MGSSQLCKDLHKPNSVRAGVANYPLDADPALSRATASANLHPIFIFDGPFAAFLETYVRR